MSLVGPRPLPLRDYEQPRGVAPQAPTSCLPGVTGPLADLRPPRASASTTSSRLDSTNLENWSIWLGHLDPRQRRIPAVARGPPAPTDRLRRHRRLRARARALSRAAWPSLVGVDVVVVDNGGNAGRFPDGVGAMVSPGPQPRLRGGAANLGRAGGSRRRAALPEPGTRSVGAGATSSGSRARSRTRAIGIAMPRAVAPRPARGR